MFVYPKRTMLLIQSLRNSRKPISDYEMLTVLGAEVIVILGNIIYYGGITQYPSPF